MDVKHDIITTYKTPFKTVMIVLPADVNDVPGNVIPCIRLSVATSECFRRAFPAIRSRSGSFLIYLDEHFYDDALTDLLLHSFFSTNYLFFNGSPVVVSGPGITNDDVELMLNSLSVKIRLHGFAGIFLWRTDSVEQGPDHLSQPVYVDKNTLINKEWLQTNLLRDLDSLTNHIILDFDGKTDAIEKLKTLDNECKMFLSKQPVIAASMNEYISLKETVSHLRLNQKQTEEKLAGADKTIGVIRTKYKDDYENLFKWYHNEYEILPLWYKRFGHILKVIMGRRSFRSLFSDDVKKYKN
ncbi:MAG: hypothetical protein EOO04_08405 [Chitinophagaceae bacterium]|nr:MAG: hypothetical protein EOO04_08405 [Chitinophagaceae bacterium]